MALIITPGALDAEAYIDVEYADDYIEKHVLRNESWFALPEKRKEVAIRAATLSLDRNLRWTGTPTYSTQALQHPRKNIKDKFGNDFPEDEILPEVKQANAELALWLVNNVPSAELANFGYIKVGGSISFKINDGTVFKSIPSEIFRIVDLWAVRRDAISVVRLVRA